VRIERHARKSVDESEKWMSKMGMLYAEADHKSRWRSVDKGSQRGPRAKQEVCSGEWDDTHVL
jgi:hypothetical protein